jgi:tryptophan halogenase
MLHQHLKVSQKKFYEAARPTWKLGLKFAWGRRSHFFYSFSSQQMNHEFPELPRPIGNYCDADMSYAEPIMSMMEHGRVFERNASGAPTFHNALAYHFENHLFVAFLESQVLEQGIQIIDDTVSEVRQDESGITGLALKSGRIAVADLYVDCSGFASLLLGKALSEPFIPFKSSLFCDRAIVGGWTRQPNEPILPYTSCSTMNSGWLWQIEHETRINRGYVYCSSFISDEEAEREFRAQSPRVGQTRVVRFVTGRYARAWVKNVVALGNANGFVEPLEATALGVIAVQSRLLTDALLYSDRRVGPMDRDGFNRHHARYWDSIRRFIAIHYKHNDRLDTPFWRTCRQETDLAGAEEVVAHYQAVGPSMFWGPTVIDSLDPFGIGGYVTLLLGQQVPYRTHHQPGPPELIAFHALRQRHRERAMSAMTSEVALATLRSPGWQWLK